MAGINRVKLLVLSAISNNAKSLRPVSTTSSWFGNEVTVGTAFKEFEGKVDKTKFHKNVRGMDQASVNPKEDSDNQMLTRTEKLSQLITVEGEVDIATISVSCIFFIYLSVFICFGIQSFRSCNSWLKQFCYLSGSANFSSLFSIL